jgi:hypothetical protein
VSSREALGVDIGGVIISKVGGEADTSFSGTNYLETAEVPGALDVIKQLVDYRFGERVFLVSKCGPRVQAKTLRWLKHHHFFERTGVMPKHVRFCLERSDKEAICRKLGITYFIDDRVDVLQSLKSVPHRFLLDFSPRESDREGRAASSSAIRIASRWSEIGEVLLPHSGRLNPAHRSG